MLNEADENSLHHLLSLYNLVWQTVVIKMFVRGYSSWFDFVCFVKNNFPANRGSTKKKKKKIAVSSHRSSKENQSLLIDQVWKISVSSHRSVKDDHSLIS